MDLKNSEKRATKTKLKVSHGLTSKGSSTRHADRPVNEWEAQKQTLVCRAKCLPTTNAVGEAEYPHVKKWLLPVLPHIRVNSKQTRHKRAEITKPLSKQRKTASWHWI